MKTSNKQKTHIFKRAAVLITAAVLTLILTACPNSSGGGSKPKPKPKPAVTKYKVTFSVEGANGTLTAKLDGKTITSGAEAEKDKTVLFTAAPASGYRVKGWTLDGTAVNGTNSTYSLNITKAVTVKVSFEDDSTPLPQHAVTFSVEGVNGTLSAKADGAPLTSGNTVQEGKTVTFTAAPNPGYEVKEWKITGAGMTFEEGTGTPQNNTACVILKAPLTVKVVFKEKTLTPKHLVTMTAGAHGSISADPALPSDGMVEEGKKIVFTASPEAGYAVDKWSITGGQTLLGGTEGSGTAMVKITGPVTVHVSFKVKTFKVDFGVAGTPPNGSLSAVYKEGGAFTSGTSVPENTLLVFTASPAAGFKVEKWTVNNETVAGNTANTYEHRVTKAARITVSFISSVAVPDEFTLANGEEYKVTDKVKKHVIMTKPNENVNGVYTLSTAVEYEGITYTLTGLGGAFLRFYYVSAFALSGESEFLSTAGGVLFDKAQTKLIRYPEGKAGTSYTVPEGVRVLGKESFYYCDNLTSVILPDGLTTLESGALSACRKLATVNLPSSLTSIGPYFLHYTAVEAVIIPEGISELGWFSLSYCEKLKTLELPSTLSDIKEAAFCKDCTAIESVTCKAAAPPATSSSYDIFELVDLSGVTLKVPAGSVNAYKTANGWKKFGTITALP